MAPTGKKFILFFLCFCLVLAGYSQQVKILADSVRSSLRGLSVVDDNVVWVSGSSGTVGRSNNGGASWKWVTVKGFEKSDFRDVEAFDEMTALIMSVSEPAYILRTVDGGDSWKVVYENKTKGMFLDAMEFWNEQSGIVIGDPIDNRFFIARTFDGGSTWKDIPVNFRPTADSGEACFASSGTNIRKLDKQEAVFVSGGLRSRVFIRDKKIEIPILQGTESSGANSIAVKDKKTLIVVGGDFSKKDSSSRTCVLTRDGGEHWNIPSLPPHGYRSCVEWLGGKKWICCGLNGVDFSIDNGDSWFWTNKTGFNVCRKAKNGKAVYLAGVGRVGRFLY